MLLTDVLSGNYRVVVVFALPLVLLGLPYATHLVVLESWMQVGEYDPAVFRSENYKMLFYQTLIDLERSKGLDHDMRRIRISYTRHDFLRSRLFYSSKKHKIQRKYDSNDNLNS